MYDQAQNPEMLKGETEYSIRTRSGKKRLFKIKRPFTEKFKKSLAYLGPKKWNRLPETFHHVEQKYSYKLLVSNMIKDNSIKFMEVGPD